jgi:hypothetical protein
VFSHALRSAIATTQHASQLALYEEQFMMEIVYNISSGKFDSEFVRNISRPLKSKKSQTTKTSRSCRSKKKSKNTHFNPNTLSKNSQAHTFLCKHNFKCTHFHANMFIKKIDYLS